jgi:hypothetical protein
MSSNNNPISVGNPQLHPVVIYWDRDRSNPGIFIFMIVALGTLWVPIEISVIGLGQGFRDQTLWSVALLSCRHRY